MDPSYEATLNVVHGPLAGLVIPIHRRWGNVTIGSDPACSVPVTGAGIAAIEARLWIDDAGITVYPTRAVVVNGRSVEEPCVLRHGDVFAVADVIALELRQRGAAPVDLRAETGTRGALALAPAMEPVVVTELVAAPAGVVGPLAHFARTALAVPGLAGSAVAWRLAQARLGARRQVRRLKARLKARARALVVDAPGRKTIDVKALAPRLALGPRPVSSRAAVRIPWTARVASAFRYLMLTLGRRKPAAPALRVVGGTQHRPVPGARRLAAEQLGRRLAATSVTIAVIMLSLLFFRPAVRGLRDALSVPSVSANSVAPAVLHEAPRTPAVRPAVERKVKTSARRAVKRASLETRGTGTYAD